MTWLVLPLVESGETASEPVSEPVVGAGNEVEI
jgi:hypothetical protein